MKIYIYNTPSHCDVLLINWFLFLNKSLSKAPKVLTKIEHKNSQFAMTKAQITNLENSEIWILSWALPN